MEDNTSQEQVTQVAPPQSTSFSTQPKAKSGGSKWLVIFILLLILGGAGIFFFTRSANKIEATPTPGFGVVPIEDEPQEEATSTPASVDKKDIGIEIQNGTGIPGEAAYLQTQLKNLGYTDIKTGNASSTDHTTTTVTFAKSVPQTVQDEIKDKLEDIYKDVSVKTSSSQSTDVLIVTGIRGSQTIKPAASSTPKASGSPKASSTPTSSPKATSTP